MIAGRLPFGDPATAEGSVVQIAFVVRDLGVAMNHWITVGGAGPFFKAALAVPCRYRGHPAVSSVTIAVGFMGAMMIELVEPRDAGPNIYADFLKARGEGLHHLQLYAADLDRAVARFADAGSPLLSDNGGGPYGRSLFVDSLDALGYYIELGSYPAPLRALIDRVHAAHVRWDGEDSVRPYPLDALS